MHFITYGFKGKRMMNSVFFFVLVFLLTACGKGGIGDGDVFGKIEIDETKPIISIQGNKTEIVPVGADYVDAGALADDESDGDISTSITITSDVDTTVEGTYSVLYTVIDDAGNITIEIRVVIVEAANNFVDISPPVITLKGEPSVSVALNEAYVDAGAIANDNVDGDLSTSITMVSDVDTDVEGTYSVLYTVLDEAGNISNKVRIVTVKAIDTFVDTSAPVISITGEPSVSVVLNDVYDDAGATANDNVDGDITAKILTTSNVDTSKAGIYTVIYTVTDVAGSSSTVVRTVSVAAVFVDDVKPIITLLGNNPETIEVGTTYVDAGAVAFDKVSGELTTEIKARNKVEATKVGIYSVSYTVKDEAGNRAKATRKVNVVMADDIIKPVITLIGGDIKVEKDKTYTEKGATAKDDVDGDITDKIVINGTVNTAKVGTYLINYSVVDAAGNTAKKLRSVEIFTIADTVKPKITVKGQSPVNLKLGLAYKDAGATATDNIDGNLTSSIISKGSVNTKVVGVYKIKYSVKDAAGNTAIATRTVNVTNKLPTALIQAARVAGGEYRYGFNSTRRIPIVDAPADTDRSRFAILHDGNTYRLYFFKVGSNDTIYQFAYNSAKGAYVHGGNAIKVLKISGMPADADAGSFSMLHDGTNYRLYMLGKKNPARLYQAAYNAGSGKYEYGFQSADFDIVDAPADTDYSRWAMRHDGLGYRLNIFKKKSKTKVYMFDFQNGAYVWKAIKLAPGQVYTSLNITLMPTSVDNSNFSMLHDGANHRLYFQEK